MWYAFSGANGRTSLQAPKYDIVMPRAGFSWQVKNNMVVRGGIGVYSSTWSEDTYGQGLGAAFGSNGGINDTNTTNGLCPVVNLSASTTTANTQNPGCGVAGFNPQTISAAYITAPTTPWAQNGQNPTYNQYHTPIPTNYQYSFAVQREFLADFVAEVAYVGNHGDHLNTGSLDIDQVPEGALGQGRSATPYPLFSSVNGSTNNGRSNYNSLQAMITKRMTHGLQFNFNYTYSHFLDDQDSSGWGSRGGWQNYQNAYDIDQNYSNSNFDIRHMFKGEAIYKLPFGKGMQYLNHNLLLEETLGGWQISGTTVDQTGNPISITTGNNNSSNNLSGSYTQYANLVGNYKRGFYNINNAIQPTGNWFNPAAFAIPAANTYGNFVRNQVYGPGLNVVNFSFGKTFPIVPERNVNFELRGDSQNVLNHPSFGQPNGTAVGTGTLTNITSTTVGGRTWQIYGRLSF
jgi:hypothetical protein